MDARNFSFIQNDVLTGNRKTVDMAIATRIAVEEINAIAFGNDSDATKIAKIKDGLNDLFEPRKERKTMPTKAKPAKKAAKKVPAKAATKSVAKKSK